MDDGVTTISAYDTAWVALVEDSDKTGLPMFPSSLEWIADNQLSDGSWGDDKLFLAHDRILNTLACVVALKTWTVHPQKMERGTRIYKCSFFICIDIYIFLSSYLVGLLFCLQGYCLSEKT